MVLVVHQGQWWCPVVTGSGRQDVFHPPPTLTFSSSATLGPTISSAQKTLTALSRPLFHSLLYPSHLLLLTFSLSLSPLLASTEPWLQPALHLPAASAALTEGNAAPNWHADRFPSSNTAARRLSAEKEEEEEEEEEVEG